MPEGTQDHGATKRTERFGAVAIGVLFFCLYVATASHTIILNYDDAAEFQTVAVIGGLPHQPYPLWCILARVFTLLPVGEPAFRATLLSISAASLTLALVFLFVFRRTRSLLISLGATVPLGISITFWQNAVYADLYALNALIFVLVAWAGIRFYREPSAKRWLRFVLALGFLLVHHTTNVAVLPAVLLLLLWSGTRWYRGAAARLTIGSVLVFLLPFTLYLYTYQIDRQPHPMNWINNYGQYLNMDRGGDPKELESFAGRMRFQLFDTPRSTFESWESPPYSPSEWLRKLQTWCRLTAGWEFPVVGAALALVGLIALWVRDRKIAGFATAISIPYVLLAIYLVNGAGMQRFSNTAYVLFVLFIAEALRVARDGARRLRLPATPIVTVLVLSMLASPLIRYATYPPQDPRWSSRLAILRGSNDRGKEYGEKMSELLPPNSMVFCRWSHANTLWYHKYVKGRLQDVDVRYMLPRGEYMRDIIARQQPAAVYFTFPPEPKGFLAEEVIPVMAGMDLYKISLVGR